MKRRDFIKAVAAGSAIPVVSNVGTSPADAQAITYNVAVVGGGMAGATAAKYLRYWAKKLGMTVNVTLFEPSTGYISNILSNEVVIGLRTLSSLTYAYSNLTSATKYGVVKKNNKINFINPGDTITRATLYSSSDASGTALGQFDAVILAAGIEFDYDFSGKIERVDKTGTISTLAQMDLAVPHAWQAGPQTTALQSQLKNMTAGHAVVISIPPSPYRCPPGPYERACVIADWMKKNKPGSKVIVLDANADKQAEKPVFDYAFNNIHAGYIDYRPNKRVTRVEVTGTKERKIFTETWNGAAWLADADPITADVANIIPPMRAPEIVRKTLGDAGLNSTTSSDRDPSVRKWALISEQTYQSTTCPRIYVVGDGIFSKQPKAGHIGNQEGKVCADAILRKFMKVEAYPTPVTNSACFTPITTAAGLPGTATASWLTALYRYDTTANTVVPISGPGTGARWPSSNMPSAGFYSDMKKWFKTLMEDTFS